MRTACQLFLLLLTAAAAGDQTTADPGESALRAWQVVPAPVVNVMADNDALVFDVGVEAQCPSGSRSVEVFAMIADIVAINRSDLDDTGAPVTIPIRLSVPVAQLAGLQPKTLCARRSGRPSRQAVIADEQTDAEEQTGAILPLNLPGAFSAQIEARCHDGTGKAVNSMSRTAVALEVTLMCPVEAIADPAETRQR